MENKNRHNSRNIADILRVRETSRQICCRELSLSQFYRNMDVLRSTKFPDSSASELLYRKSSKRYITVDDDGLVKIWKTRNNHLLGVLRNNNDSVKTIALSPGEVLLAGISMTSIAIWRLQTMELITTHIINRTFPSHIFFLTQSSQHYLVIVERSFLVKFFPYNDDKVGNNVIEFHGYKGLIKFTIQPSKSPCGRYLMVVCSRLRIFTVDKDSGSPRCLLNEKIHPHNSIPRTEIEFYTLSDADWSKSGESFLTAVLGDNRITLWSLSSDGQTFEASKCFGSNRVTKLCWDVYDECVFTAHKDEQLIQLWTPSTGELVNTVNTEFEIYRLMAHPIDRGIVASFGPTEIIIWDMMGGTSLVIFSHDFPQDLIRIHCLWSHDGSELVAIFDGYITTYGHRSPLDEELQQTSDEIRTNRNIKRWLSMEDYCNYIYESDQQQSD